MQFFSENNVSIVVSDEGVWVVGMSDLQNSVAENIIRLRHKCAVKNGLFIFQQVGSFLDEYTPAYSISTFNETTQLISFHVGELRFNILVMIMPLFAERPVKTVRKISYTEFCEIYKLSEGLHISNLINAAVLLRKITAINLLDARFLIELTQTLSLPLIQGKRYENNRARITLQYDWDVLLEVFE